MTEPGRIFQHAQAAGYSAVADYALELEDILEHILHANRRPDEPEDMHAALARAQVFVDRWETRP